MRFTVPGVPVPQGSKSVSRSGHMYEANKKLRPWREKVTQVARLYCKQPLEGAILLEVTFIMPRTKAMKDKPAPPMVQKPDTDKLVRAINDSLTGVAYRDDSQVTTIVARKRRAKPGEDVGAVIRVSVDDWDDDVVLAPVEGLPWEK